MLRETRQGAPLRIGRRPGRGRVAAQSTDPTLRSRTLGGSRNAARTEDAAPREQCHAQTRPPLPPMSQSGRRSTSPRASNAAHAQAIEFTQPGSGPEAIALFRASVRCLNVREGWYDVARVCDKGAL